MKIEWDKEGERRFEMGDKNAVLYLQNSDGTYQNGVAWNGITAVTESPSGDEKTDIWADNMKYGALRSQPQFGGTIEAYTCPNEFKVCDGTAQVAPGLDIGQQTRRKFGFVYRTEVGTDMNPELGYKLHILYGCTASPSEKGYSTINDSPEAVTFSWEIEATCSQTYGTMAKFAMLIIDSTKADPDVLREIEGILFGTDETEPRLLMPGDLGELLISSSWNAMKSMLGTEMLKAKYPVGTLLNLQGDKPVVVDDVPFDWHEVTSGPVTNAWRILDYGEHDMKLRMVTEHTHTGGYTISSEPWCEGFITIADGNTMVANTTYAIGWNEEPLKFTVAHPNRYLFITAVTEHDEHPYGGRLVLRLPKSTELAGLLADPNASAIDGLQLNDDKVFEVYEDRFARNTINITYTVYVVDGERFNELAETYTTPFPGQSSVVKSDHLSSRYVSGSRELPGRDDGASEASYNNPYLAIPHGALRGNHPELSTQFADVLAYEGDVIKDSYGRTGLRTRIDDNNGYWFRAMHPFIRPNMPAVSELPIGEAYLEAAENTTPTLLSGRVNASHQVKWDVEYLSDTTWNFPQHNGYQWDVLEHTGISNMHLTMVSFDTTGEIPSTSSSSWAPEDHIGRPLFFNGDSHYLDTVVYGENAFTKSPRLLPMITFS